MALNTSPNRSDVLENDYLSSRVTVGTSEVEAKVGGGPLSGRQLLVLFNDSIRDIYVGPSGVTTSGATKGLRLSPGVMLSIPVGPNVSVFMISDKTDAAAIVQELG